MVPVAMTARPSAPAITLAPLSPQIALGTTLQFTANVAGLATTGVAWIVADTIGGTAIAGTITPTGRYTAPAIMPAQNPVSIKAISTCR